MFAGVLYTSQKKIRIRIIKMLVKIVKPIEKNCFIFCGYVNITIKVIKSSRSRFNKNVHNTQTFFYHYLSIGVIYGTHHYLSGGGGAGVGEL